MSESPQPRPGFDFGPIYERAKRASPVVHVLDGFVPEAQLERLGEVFRNNIISGNNLFWIPVASVRKHQEGDSSQLALFSQYLADPWFSAFMLDYLARLASTLPVPREEIEEIAGFEFWLKNVFPGDLSQQFHLDIDARVKQSRRIIVPCHYSTVLQVGPAEGLTGGETMFNLELSPRVMAQTFKPQSDVRFLEALSPDWIKVARKPGRFICFSGYLPHVVLPVERVGGSECPRQSLVVNVWKQVPMAFQEIRGFSPYSPEVVRRVTSLSGRQMDVIKLLFNTLPIERIADIHRAWNGVIPGDVEEAMSADVPVVREVLDVFASVTTEQFVSLLPYLNRRAPARGAAAPHAP